MRAARGASALQATRQLIACTVDDAQLWSSRNACRHADSMRPDSQSFALALRSLAASGLLAEAQQLVAVMRLAGVPANPECTAALVVTAAVAGQPDVATAIWLRSGLADAPPPHHMNQLSETCSARSQLEGGQVWPAAAAEAASGHSPIFQPHLRGEVVAFRACALRLLQDLLRAGNPGAAVTTARMLYTLPMPQHSRPVAVMGPEPHLLAFLLRAAGAARPLLDGVPLSVLATAPSTRLRLYQASLDTGGVMSDCINAR
eukprot:jgi/Ulvmu1/7160/UM034_0068.1